MSDQGIPTSGSRWEPATRDLTTPADDAAVPVEPAALPTRVPRRSPGRTAVAAAGVGLVLAGGAGGFAIGHAVAGNAVSGRTVTDQNGVPGDGSGGRPDFRDGYRPGGVRPDGTAPGGTAPGNPPPDTGGDGGTA